MVHKQPIEDSKLLISIYRQARKSPFPLVEDSEGLFGKRGEMINIPDLLDIIAERLLRYAKASCKVNTDSLSEDIVNNYFKAREMLHSWLDERLDEELLSPALLIDRHSEVFRKFADQITSNILIYQNKIQISLMRQEIDFLNTSISDLTSRSVQQLKNMTVEVQSLSELIQKQNDLLDRLGKPTRGRANQTPTPKTALEPPASEE